MARSVLWIDAREVALLLGESVTPRPTESPSTGRRFDQRSAAIARPPVAEPPDEPPVRVEHAVPTPPAPARQPFSFSSGANLEGGLDSFLAWVEDRHATTCCYIADSDGLLLASRKISNASSPFAVTGLLSQHLDEISAFATAPLRGYCVFETPEGSSTSTWTERDSRRFVVVLEGAEALADGEVDEVRAALFELFRKAS